MPGGGVSVDKVISFEVAAMLWVKFHTPCFAINYHFMHTLRFLIVSINRIHGVIIMMFL